MHLKMIWPMIWAILLTISIACASVVGLHKIERRSLSDINDAIEKTNGCKCVRHYLCKNGNIITNGTGLLERRTSIPKSCRSESGIEGEQVCCKLDSIKNNFMAPKINSEKAEDKFSWMAAIFHRTTQGNFEFKCAGTLIHKKVVLTASHCLDGYSPGDIIVVVNGKKTRSSYVNSNEDDKRHVSQIIRHYGYKEDTLYNDAALLILKEEFKIGGPNNIQVLRLQDSDQIDLRAYRCYVTGWGENKENKISDVLKKQELPFVEHSKCQALLRKTALGEYFILDDSFLCAGGRDGEDACRGDGGGPLICQSLGSDYYLQVGIVSWGMGCRLQNVPGIYADIQKISEWIQNEIDNNI